jgi:hypothetical protein
MNMQAKATQLIAVLSYVSIEGENIIEVECRDYDHYKSLPEVVDVSGELFTRTGWNSDTQLACYKSNRKVAYPVPIDRQRG